jgi:hypothetical protein
MIADFSRHHIRHLYETAINDAVPVDNHVPHLL